MHFMRLYIRASASACACEYVHAQLRALVKYKYVHATANPFVMYIRACDVHLSVLVSTRVKLRVLVNMRV